MDYTALANPLESPSTIKNNAYATISIVGLVTSFLFRVLSHQGMSQDGSWGMLKIFHHANFSLVSGREFEGILNQFAVIVGLKTALVKDVQTLSFLTSIPTFGWPCLFLCLAIYWSRDSKILLITTVTSAIVIDSLSSGEFLPSTLMVSIVILLFSLIQIKTKMSVSQQLLLLSLSVVTIRCYEMFFIFAPIIAWALIRRYKNGLQKNLCLIALVILICAFLANLSEYALQTNAYRATNFSSGTNLSVIAQHVPVGIIGAFLFLILIFLISSLDHALSQIITWAYYPLGVVFIFIVIFVGVRVGPIVHWYMRGPVLGLIAVFLFTSLVLTNRHTKNLQISIRPSLLMLPVLINFLAVYNTSSGWIEYRSAIERQTNFPQKNERITGIQVSADLNRDYSSSWATPSLSMLLRHNNDAVILPNGFAPYYLDFEGQSARPINVYWKQNWCRSCIIAEN